MLVTHKSEPDWVIMTDDDRIVGLNRLIGSFAGDGSDGKKETFVLIPPYMLDKGLVYEGCRMLNGGVKFERQTPILYPDKETAESVLPRVAAKMELYYGVKKCRVAKIFTNHIIETNYNYLPYEEKE